MVHTPSKDEDVRFYPNEKARRDRKNLVVREDAKVDVPVLYVNPTMRGICNAIDGDLHFLHTLRSCSRADGLNNLFNWYDGPENIGAGREGDDASFARDQGEKIVDL